MSDITTVTAPAEHEHEHDKNLAHHFETPLQQFEAGKLGLWLFLTTEILLFSGMFCAYAVYRHNHPEIFEYAHLWLNKILGGINTLVLIFSSFTMAWAVRAAQLGQRKLLVALLSITLLCGFGFMGIKFVEYKAKFEHHTLWGERYNPHEPPVEGVTHKGTGAESASPHEGSAPAAPAPPAASPNAAPAGAPGTDAAAALPVGPDGYIQLHTEIKPTAEGPQGVDPSSHHAGETLGPEPANVQIFFGIYFVMTGLHGLHVLAGMVVIFWILLRAIRGDFGPHYFNPVDFTGLYWHLVDLIWIFLFPLLYLIH